MSMCIKKLSKNVKMFAGSTNTLYSYLTSMKNMLQELHESITMELKDKTILYTSDIERKYKTIKHKKRKNVSFEDYLDVLFSEKRFNALCAVPKMVIYYAVDINTAMSNNMPLHTFKEFVNELMDRSDRALVTSGDMVGIVAAQSCSERFTQATLNTFHSAGMKGSAVTGIKRIEDVLDGRKTLKVPLLGPIICTNPDDDPLLLVEKKMDDYCDECGIFFKPSQTNNSFVVYFKGISHKTWNDIIKHNIHESIRDMMRHSKDTLYWLFPKEVTLDQIKIMFHSLRYSIVTGIQNCIDYDPDDKMLVFARKTQIVDHSDTILEFCPSAVLEKLSSNDIYYIESTYGIAAAEIFIYEELKKTLGNEGININDRHIRLIAANMTSTGEIMPNTFSGMNIDDSVILKATFQESTKTFANAAAENMTDNLNDVSAQILIGSLSKIGTSTIKTYYKDVGNVIEREIPKSPEYAPTTPEYAELPEGFNEYIPATPEYAPATPPQVVDINNLPEPDILL